MRRGVAERIPPSSHLGLVSVRFEVEPTPTFDIEETAEHLKNSELSKIPAEAALGFLGEALSSSSTFNSEMIDTILDEKEMMDKIVREGESDENESSKSDEE